MRFHRVREAVAKDSIVVQRVTGGNDPATSEMVADILTNVASYPVSADTNVAGVLRTTFV